MLARIVLVVAEDLGQSEFHTRVGAALHEARTAIELLEQLSDPREVWVFSGRPRLLTRYTLDVAA